MSKALPIIVGLGVAGLTTVLLTREASAASAVTTIPTTDNIITAQSPDELDLYYEWIGELYLSNVITEAEYNTLYDAYVVRFNELTGGTI